MEKSKLWSVIHAERRALAADLEGLADSDWERPSLCTGWTVRQVVAHMAATARLTPARFFPKLAASGFSLTRLQEKDIRIILDAGPAQPLAAFRAIVDTVGGPPGPGETILGETIVHAEDIRRALGMDHEYAGDALAAVGDFYGGSNLIIGGKRRVAGVRLQATDREWTHGAGPEVSGPLLALVMATAGRASAYDDQLQGPGQEILRSRT